MSATSSGKASRGDTSLCPRPLPWLRLSSRNGCGAPHVPVSPREDWIGGETLGWWDHFDAKKDAAAELALPLLFPDRQPETGQGDRLWPVATLGDAIPFALPLVPLLSVAEPGEATNAGATTAPEARLTEVTGQSASCGLPPSSAACSTERCGAPTSRR